MREIRASKCDVQMKMSRNRKAGRLLWRPARTAALPYPLRRKLQATGPKCGYWLATVPLTEVSGFHAGLSDAGGMQHVTTDATGRARS